MFTALAMRKSVGFNSLMLHHETIKKGLSMKTVESYKGWNVGELVIVNDPDSPYNTYEGTISRFGWAGDDIFYIITELKNVMTMMLFYPIQLQKGGK